MFCVRMCVYLSLCACVYVDIEKCTIFWHAHVEQCAKVAHESMSAVVELVVLMDMQMRSPDTLQMPSPAVGKRQIANS